MIKHVEQKFITREMRALTLKRALFTVPFFTRLDFAVNQNPAKNNALVAQKVGINNAFFLTEVVGNLGEVNTAAGVLCNVSVWTMYEQSVYRYDTSQLLPSGFVATEARFQTLVANQLFDDRQREFMPFPVKDGDSLFAQVIPVGTPSVDTTATIVLKGFNVIPNAYIDTETIEKCEQSLDREARFESFKFTVEDDVKKVYTIENDAFPRLVLGFGTTNTVTNKADVSTATVQVRDATRRLQFSQLPIPLDFIAPRLTCLLDEHLYYLPIEYYLEPYGKLQFEIDNSYNNGTPAGFEFNVLTRTV